VRIWTIAISLVLLACGSDDAKTAQPDAALPDAPEPDAPDLPLGDILDELKAIPDVQNVEERPTDLAGYRFFVFEYVQPVDHANAGGATFAQRMTLLHRDYAAPVVVQNSGYNVSTRGNRTQIAVLTEANQLSMEHRYFLPSRPEPADWSKLTIEQAATDQHRITLALKARIYKTNKFLTTGASKGGMTSLFHRRFYPDDVDGTVAYVAPIDYPPDAMQSPTNRYFVFLENVGTDATCRQKLKDVQNIILARRTAMKQRMATQATYTILNPDKALEFAVEELPFIFWQYGGQSQCATIPTNAADDDTVFQFFDGTIGVASYGDADITAFLPYYHQSSTQLGYPISDESYLVGLQYPNQDTAQAYVPAGIPIPPYDNGAAMTDIQSWISSSGSQIMLIYGGRDPWSAGAVDLGNATDSFKYVGATANHGANILSLTQSEQTAASNTILRWAGLPAFKRRIDPHERTAEQDEFEARRRRR
jgi:hypothetical protein